jgi:CRISPR/Cas system CSM-associated protein Csm3 (group 7 of RAMP superfamily)
MTSIGMWSGERSRRIIKRIVVEGDLVLQTPAHFGNGDGDDLCDMPLLLDPLDEAQGKITPLLTGASIAGALRNYLRQREKGFQASLPHPNDKDAGKQERETHAATLFGAFKGDDEGEQSPLIVDDALGKPETFGVEMRDGVAINPKSRTAEQNKLFDLQLWQAGTTFPLRFELLIREGDSKPKLEEALATALSGFNDPERPVTLGARKRRGYGRGKVDQWRVTRFDLTSKGGLVAWIASGRESELGLPASKPACGSNLASLLGVSPIHDARHLFTLSARFSLDGSLLIRSGSGQDDKGPDAVHLYSVRTTSRRDPKGKPIPDPILSGTSLAGALRARALKIAQTIDTSAGQTAAETLVDGMFGTDMDKFRERKRKDDRNANPHASRLEVAETVVEKAKTDLVQNRVSIDRFTGGARDTALFNEQPIFGGTDSDLVVELKLLNPACREIGLVLLLLKDLWTGDLPLGGESSVGRGRFKGKSADLTYKANGTVKTWKINGNDNGLHFEEDDVALLEGYVCELNNHLKGAVQ